MRSYLVWLVFIYLTTAFSYLGGSSLQSESEIEIISPTPGNALQGLILIQGTSLAEGFLSSELAFSAVDDPTETWFIILASDQPISNGSLGEWDTSSLTDGNYNLRLIVNRQEQNQLIFLVRGLRIRNYSPIESSTPTLSPTPLPGDPPTHTPTLPPASLTPIPPTPTDFGSNPAAIDRNEIQTSAIVGILISIASLLILGFYKIIQNRN